MPRSSTNCRVSLPSYSLSISIGSPSGIGPRSSKNACPSGSCALPGDSAKTIAVRVSAATLRLDRHSGLHRGRTLPMSPDSGTNQARPHRAKKPQTLVQLIRGHYTGWLSEMRFAVGVSDPSPEAIGASLRPSSPQASRSWLFCRLPLIEARRLLAASFRLGLRRLRGYYARC